MNRENRGILIGMVLGDGYIKTISVADKNAGRHPAPQISFSHSIKQYDYAKHKIDVLNKMFGGKATLRTGTYTNQNGKPYTICYGNKSNKYFKTLKGMMYQDGIKTITKQVLDMLTPEGIAFWYMDDGSYRMNKRDDGTVSSIALTISTYCPEIEVDAIVNYFKDKHGIELKKAYGKGSWSVRANTSSARQLASLISQYIVPSMNYKLSCVQFLEGQECQTSDVKTCKICNKDFYALRARGMCSDCYNKEYYSNLKLFTRTCQECGKEKTANLFDGKTCSACGQRGRRHRKMI